MPIWRGRRPSDRIKAVLMGKVAMEDEEEGIQSACSKHIYDGAKSILAIPDKEKRRRALDRLPALIRPHIEREAWRIFMIKGKR
jgi:hypothetical protein